MDIEIKTGALGALGRSGGGSAQIAALRHLIDTKNTSLLNHRYFRLCRARDIGKKQMIEVVKQLYCFSVFFERLLTRRIAEYTSAMDPRVIAMARKHLREEIGHAELFSRCLEANGISSAELSTLMPKMFTKAMFGYLTATVQHENEYVSNVAIMQVMESIGYHFFTATLDVMKAHGLMAHAMQEHSEDDAEHANLGVELAAQFDAATMSNCHRIVADLYRLMGFVLDEWLGVHNESPSAAPERKRRSSRPPRSN
jgi:thiaminase